MAAGLLLLEKSQSRLNTNPQLALTVYAFFIGAELPDRMIEKILFREAINLPSNSFVQFAHTVDPIPPKAFGNVRVNGGPELRCPACRVCLLSGNLPVALQRERGSYSKSRFTGS